MPSCWFTKSYQKDSLLDGQIEIERRIGLISFLSARSDISIPETCITFDEDKVIYKQRRVKRVAGVPNYDDLRSLVFTLDEMSGAGFVHGDLNKKNILLSDDGLVIVDLEPSLTQMIDGKIQYMITRPYVACDDLKEGLITVSTDKVGFYFYLQRVTGKLSSRQVVEIANDMCLQSGLYGMAWQKRIISMSYGEILRSACQ